MCPASMPATCGPVGPRTARGRQCRRWPRAPPRRRPEVAPARQRISSSGILASFSSMARRLFGVSRLMRPSAPSGSRAEALAPPSGVRRAALQAHSRAPLRWRQRCPRRPGPRPGCRSARAAGQDSDRSKGPPGRWRRSRRPRRCADGMAGCEHISRRPVPDLGPHEAGGVDERHRVVEVEALLLLGDGGFVAHRRAAAF